VEHAAEVAVARRAGTGGVIRLGERDQSRCERGFRCAAAGGCDQLSGGVEDDDDRAVRGAAQALQGGGEGGGVVATHQLADLVVAGGAARPGTEVGVPVGHNAAKGVGRLLETDVNLVAGLVLVEAPDEVPRRQLRQCEHRHEDQQQLAAKRAERQPHL